MYVILVYDISVLTSEGRKKLRNTFKLCKKYLNHVQNSVFEGELSESELARVKIEINTIINCDTDSVIIFSSKNAKWLNKDILGIQEDKTDNFI